MASVVHSWPILANFGQSCPRGVVVHPAGGPPRTAMGVEVRKFSAKSVRATDTAVWNTAARGVWPFATVARAGGGARDETHAPQLPRSRQRGRRLCARRRRALLMVPGSLCRGPIELSKNKCTRRVFRHGLNLCGSSALWLRLVQPGGAPARLNDAEGSSTPIPGRATFLSALYTHIIRKESCHHSRAA